MTARSLREEKILSWVVPDLDGDLVKGLGFQTENQRSAIFVETLAGGKKKKQTLLCVNNKIVSS